MDELLKIIFEGILDGTVACLRWLFGRKPENTDSNSTPAPSPVDPD
jgi:hypothetical protein